MTLGLMLAPYRLVRRRERRRVLVDVRHREQLTHSATITAATHQPALALALATPAAVVELSALPTRGELDA